MPKKLLVNRVCNEFCSLLLSKPLVILDIPQLRELIDTCRSSTAGCCGKSFAKEKVAEKVAYSMLSSLEEEEIKNIRKALLDRKQYTAINIKFPKIKKELIL